jgi:hypothetical protein
MIIYQVTLNVCISTLMVSRGVYVTLRVIMHETVRKTPAPYIAQPSCAYMTSTSAPPETEPGNVGTL